MTAGLLRRAGSLVLISAWVLSYAHLALEAHDVTSGGRIVECTCDSLVSRASPQGEAGGVSEESPVAADQRCEVEKALSAPMLVGAAVFSLVTSISTPVSQASFISVHISREVLHWAPKASPPAV